jgi:hypothetical protein
MDLSFLRPLYEGSTAGPRATWCSAYLDVSRDHPDAPTATRLRWRQLAGQLREQGADEPTLDAMGGVLEALPDDTGPKTASMPPGMPSRPAGMAMFARDGVVALTVRLPSPPPRDVAVAAALPHPLPLAVQLGERVPWLRVVVDRTGADLLAAPTGSVPRAMRVPGPERYPLRKAAPGGWSQPRYQRAAEETWDRNAARVSEVVGNLAAQVRARVLLLAGDVRERALVAEHLAEELPPGIRVVQTDAGSRAEGAAEQPLAEATDSAVRDEAARQRDAVLDAYRQECGRASRGMAPTAASVGLPEVVEALREGKVDTLLVDPDELASAASAMDCRLWVGVEPEQIGIDMAELRAMGATEPWPERAEDALLRTATSIEADLLAVSGDEAPLVDGVGAYLRYP